MQQMTRRSVLGASGIGALALLAACGGSSNSSGSQSTESSAAPASSQASSAAASVAPAEVETGVRTEAGYHLNEQVEGAPTVTLYTDLQCPYCAKGEPAYEQAALKLKGEMNVVVRHFPLPSHGNAVPAAQAVQAAEDQGKHIAMAHKIFAGQDTWKNMTNQQDLIAQFNTYAKELELDQEKFLDDLTKTANLDLINKEFAAGKEIGVAGTPSFAVNGKVLDNVDSATSADDMVTAFKKAAGIS